MNTGNARATLLLAVILLGAAGCAPGGGTTTAPPATAPAATASATGSTETGGGAAGTPSGGSAAATSAAVITIRDFAYGPPLVVAAGAVVTVTNMDGAEHTVTADDGPAFDVDVKGSGGTASFTAPSTPGTYAFHCTFHPGMHGTLTVK
ncbi:cupredoxin domain-containing protein [uncultured Arthrobacter sp.]|uniref:cupredoxin domain-containing protein n=1 Tax=uncultured Arthrobacter sp. TaxID=114050 RepID=UPI003216D262